MVINSDSEGDDNFVSVFSFFKVLVTSSCSRAQNANPTKQQQQQQVVQQWHIENKHMYVNCIPKGHSISSLCRPLSLSFFTLFAASCLLS